MTCENAADSLCKPLAFQTDASKNCGSSFSRQSTLFTDDEAQMSWSRMTTDTSLFSDELPTTSAPMSSFSQEEQPVESSGKTGFASMPDSHFQLLDAQLASEDSDGQWEWHAGETHSAVASDELWDWHTGPLPHISLQNRAGQAFGVSQRDISASPAPTAALTPAQVEQAEDLTYSAVDINPPMPPPLSRNPFLRKLQAAAWQNRPFLEMRMYLMAYGRQAGYLGPFSTQAFVHQSTDSFTFDILDEQNFKEAGKLGKLLLDTQMRNPDDGIEVYVYADKEAKEYVQKNMQILDTIDMPLEIKKTIKVIRQTPFPKFVDDDGEMLPSLRQKRLNNPLTKE
ncbi:unnamed protein product [Polarella glacialis]|uniref:Uncharacterized protein n=1 Tax=Polarella glacialis TaxID=89957 RepID=A0A813EQL4_POLGL|nr:unnamed protein product [Polarella glacialis]